MENFIDTMGYESILSEKGSIPYNPDIPLDESCYRESQGCDILVLIIGGRYGSAASNQGELKEMDFYSRFESITKLEYENAVKNDVPVYILIEKTVYSEYDTFKRNRDNKSIQYAHADSINIFLFIDQILSQSRNNPIFHFEKYNEIEMWLKQQWAGLFQDLIKKRKTQAEISELSKEVKELSNLNTTLKRYLEDIVTKTDKVKGGEIIKEEEKRLAYSRVLSKLSELDIAKEFMSAYSLSFEDAVEVISKPNSFKEMSQILALITHREDDGESLYKHWKTSGAQISINKMRAALGLPSFELYN